MYHLILWISVLCHVDTSISLTVLQFRNDLIELHFYHQQGIYIKKMRGHCIIKKKSEIGLTLNIT